MLCGCGCGSVAQWVKQQGTGGGVGAGPRVRKRTNPPSPTNCWSEAPGRGGGGGVQEGPSPGGWASERGFCQGWGEGRGGREVCGLGPAESAPPCSNVEDPWRRFWGHHRILWPTGCGGEFQLPALWPAGRSHSFYVNCAGIRETQAASDWNTRRTQKGKCNVSDGEGRRVVRGIGG